ncbi:MAG: SRPBCC family protein [Lapillicoccus sp.]
MKRTITVSGHASPAEAWERYAVPARWREWSPPISRVETTGTRIVPGLAGVVHGIGGIRVNFLVEAVDEDARTWRWRARLGPLEIVLDHGVAAGVGGSGGAGGSSTWLTVAGPPLAALIYPEIARISLRQLVS